MLKRELYLSKIWKFVNQPVIKVLIGQRRVGKSSILKLIQLKLKEQGIPPQNIIEINKESLTFEFIQTYADLATYVAQKSQNIKGKIYLCIDEVQEISEFEKALRSFLVEEKYDIYITGSNSNMLSSDIATMLSGRYISFTIFPLTFNEFQQFHDISDKQKALKLFLRYGGMPYLHKFPLEDEMVSEYLSNIHSTIILKDIVKRFQVRNINFLENIIFFLSENIGSIFSANKISNFLKSQKIIHLSPRVIIKYLGYICSAFFCYEVKKQDIKGKKIFQFQRKYYVGDIGMRNVLLQYPQENYGRVLENIVYLHLRSHGYAVKFGDINGRKIDFIAQKNTQKIYIQVAQHINSPKIEEREFGNLMKIKDNFRKMVISEEIQSEVNYQGIEHTSLLTFLTIFH